MLIRIQLSPKVQLFFFFNLFLTLWKGLFQISVKKKISIPLLYLTYHLAIDFKRIGLHMCESIFFNNNSY